MPVATMPTLTPEQLAAITAQAIATHKAERKAKKEAKPSKLAADVQQINKLEQASASERDKLISEGHKLCGIGLTNERVAWANKVISYARLQADNKTAMLRTIDELQRSILHMGKDVSSDTVGKKGNMRTINESLRLACVAHFVPQVKLIDWGCALLFIRFLDGFNPAEPAIVQMDECKKIALAVVTRKEEYRNKNGFIDRKKVKEAIDALLGKREMPSKEDDDTEGEAETESEAGVTSIHAVANWLKQAGNSDIVQLMSMLAPQEAANITQIMIENLPSQ